MVRYKRTRGVGRKEEGRIVDGRMEEVSEGMGRVGMFGRKEEGRMEDEGSGCQQEGGWQDDGSQDGGGKEGSAGRIWTIWVMAG